MIPVALLEDSVRGIYTMDDCNQIGEDKGRPNRRGRENGLMTHQVPAPTDPVAEVRGEGLDNDQLPEPPEPPADTPVKNDSQNPGHTKGQGERTLVSTINDWPCLEDIGKHDK